MQRGQLGHGDLLQRNIPIIVKGLSGKKVTAGSVTASHYNVQQSPLLHASVLWSLLYLCSVLEQKVQCRSWWQAPLSSGHQ